MRGAGNFTPLSFLHKPLREALNFGYCGALVKEKMIMYIRAYKKTTTSVFVIVQTERWIKLYPQT